MPPIYENKHVRMVRVFTDSEAFDGFLSLTPLGRTIDELNAPSRVFLALDSPAVVYGEKTVGDSQLAINKGSILFAMELDPLADVPRDLYPSSERRRFVTSVLSLYVRDYSIEGNVHVLENGNVMTRIYQPGHPFLALTAVSIVKPGFELTTPFLAVNRSHVLLAQESCKLSAVMIEPTASTS